MPDLRDRVRTLVGYDDAWEVVLDASEAARPMGSGMALVLERKLAAPRG